MHVLGVQIRVLLKVPRSDRRSPNNNGSGSFRTTDSHADAHGWTREAVLPNSSYYSTTRRADSRRESQSYLATQIQEFGNSNER